nr:MAG TPA: hypothetical protein [Bacteriophage sp.]
MVSHRQGQRRVCLRQRSCYRLGAKPVPASAGTDRR